MLVAKPGMELARPLIGFMELVVSPPKRKQNKLRRYLNSGILIFYGKYKDFFSYFLFSFLPFHSPLFLSFSFFPFSLVSALRLFSSFIKSFAQFGSKIFSSFQLKIILFMYFVLTLFSQPYLSMFRKRTNRQCLYLAMWETDHIF